MAEKGIVLSINRILEEVAAIRKVTTFFDDLDKPEKVESFTIGSEQGEAIEQIYHLKEKYR